MKLTPRERFLAKVCPEPNGGCWLWRGQVRADGYGLAWLEGKSRVAHRVAWVLFRGQIDSRLVVCHKCDVPTCVNPDHLFLGTPRDNARDRNEKGRGVLGERVHSSKLSEAQVRGIKTALAEGRLYMTELAREYAVSVGTIARIARGLSWRHVKADTPQAPAPANISADPATQEPMISEDDPNRDL